MVNTVVVENLLPLPEIIMTVWMLIKSAKVTNITFNVVFVNVFPGLKFPFVVTVITFLR